MNPRTFKIKLNDVEEKLELSVIPLFCPTIPSASLAFVGLGQIEFLYIHNGPFGLWPWASSIDFG